MTDYKKQREIMVASQIRPNRVTEPGLLKALLAEPREAYLPEGLKPLAYMDGHIDLSAGFPSARHRYLLAPMVLAQLIQLARPSIGGRILDVACATGYSTGLLARLGGNITGLEDDQALAEFARAALKAQGHGNAAIFSGPLTQGAASAAPFDVILFNGALATLPEAYFEQLAEQGRLVAVMVNGADYKAVLYEKIAGTPRSMPAFDANVPKLQGFERKQVFVF